MLAHRREVTGSARAPLLITLAVFLAWGLVWAAVWYQATGRGLMLGLRSSYLKIELAPGKLLWVEAKGRRCRTAETPQALEKTSWTQSESWDWENRGHEISLNMEPEAVGLQSASLGLDASGGRFQATWNIVEKDSRGELWACTAEGEVQAVRSPARAQILRVPRLSRASLKLVPQPEDQQGKPVVRVALQLQDEGFDISDVTAAGRQLQGEARVLDASGRLIGKKKAKLSDLGFT